MYIILSISVIEFMSWVREVFITFRNSTVVISGFMGFNRRFDKKFDFRDFSLSMSTYIPREDLRVHFILS